ncbi:uncharacterized protein G2W53_001002 [Senna tora]|uniref:Uncharacterized protein n=1 Tax=Senna tora TaxID=362788 RepID=A0A835CM65_9FABA|nr:uncharacterized protein G2W53_001002 [Senna tora]
MSTATSTKHLVGASLAILAAARSSRFAAASQ